MSARCDCCAGTKVLTPVMTANRPGLPALSYRVGTHATFLETMKARLSNLYVEIPDEGLDEFGRQKLSRIYPLRDLKTRSADDPAIAWLDAWATVGAVLTFYQERLANEGYLRTATERRSILELARLIGYVLRPGVASTVYLAYTLDEDRSVTPPKPTAVTIPAGARAQSVPGPGELPQSFETADSLNARSPWNNLQPRLSQPQTEETIENSDPPDPNVLTPRVYLLGIATNLKANDPLLIDFGTGTPKLFRVTDAQPDAAANRTLVRLREWNPESPILVLTHDIDAIVGRYFAQVADWKVAKLLIVKEVTADLKKFDEDLGNKKSVADMVTVIEEFRKELDARLPKAEAHQRSGDLVPLLRDLSRDLDRAAVLHSSRAGHSVLSASLVKQDQILPLLLKPASIPPASSARLGRDAKTSFAKGSDARLQLLGAFQPALGEVLATALENAKATVENPIKVYALRVKAAPFGSNAPKRTKFDPDTREVTVVGEWPILEWPLKQSQAVNGHGPDVGDAIPHEEQDVVYLDSSIDSIVAGDGVNPSWIVIDSSAWTLPPGSTVTRAKVNPADRSLVITRIAEVQAGVARADYGISAKTTRITLIDSWLSIDPTEKPVKTNGQPIDEVIQAFYDVDFVSLRTAVVYAQTELLSLADEPISKDICGGAGNGESIELDRLYTGLKSGRWLIVSGERTDVRNDEGVVVPGVRATELVMLAEATQDVARTNGQDLSGDKTHTFLSLADDLAFCYKRDTVAIYGNVVKATHGETRNEVLGGGDGAKSLQQFALRQPPLTFVPAANPAGVNSTLQVRVNDVLWHEADSLAELLPTDRKFITKTDDDGKATVIFGTGQHGARLPTGQENVKAVYRNGIGKAGNAKADQISLLATRPLGVKAVTNPLRASGGADKESRDQARQNAPLAVMALDRLVSTQDYADFARTFAGIGKASARRLSDGHRQLVQVTIAGADDVPIEKSSDLYRNLLKALRDFGDPYLPIQVDVRELLALVISANIQVLPDYQLETVEPTIRATLLDAFGFQRRDLGQTVYLSEVVATIQRVAGVAYVDVDVLSSISETELSTPDGLDNKLKALKVASNPDPYVAVYLAETAAQAQQHGRTSATVTIYPAQLAFLIPDVPATLILNEVRL